MNWGGESMKRIILINPSYRDDVLETVKVLGLPPLNLAHIASVTPDRYEVRIIDEHVTPLDYDTPADLVGLTAMTPLAPRAYAIAAEFRSRGIPVVLGGIHGSMAPEEASRHVDSVVVGEGDEIWPEILSDFDADCLKPLYRTSLAHIEKIPVPRRDLFSDGYFTQTVQTSRGCPFDCNFCSVTRFNGHSYRFRDERIVLDEIASMEGRRFFFADDNLVGSGEKARLRAKRLFSGLRDLRKDWGSQICLTIADDPHLLKLAAESGAKFLFIGFESIDPDTLSAMNKKVNLRSATPSFKDAIKKIQDAGIAAMGGFILGSDNDTKDTFDRTRDFVFDTGIDVAQFTIQTPLPGTELYGQLSSEGRLTRTSYPADWKHYNGFDVVHRPRNMTEDELREGHARIYRETASLGTSLGRAVKTLFRTGSLLGAGLSFYWNYDCHKAVSKR